MADDIIVRLRAEGADKFVNDFKKVGGAVEEAEKPIKEWPEAVDSAAKETEKANKRISSSAKKVGVALAAAFSTAKLIQFAKESVKLANIQLKAEAQLLKALGGREDAQKRLIAQAKRLQSVTTFGDEEIIAQQAYLASLEFTEDQINKIIKASVDLSAGANISLESSVRNIAKTYSGLSGELGELIPQLRDLTQEQLKSGEGVRILTELYEGQAEVLRNTGTGAVVSLQNAVGDLQEEFGKAIIQGVQPLANSLQQITENEYVLNFFRAIGTAIGDALQAASVGLQVIARLGGDLADLLNAGTEAGAVKSVEELNEELDAAKKTLSEFEEAKGKAEDRETVNPEEIAAIQLGIDLWEKNVASLESVIAARGKIKGIDLSGLLNNDTKEVEEATVVLENFALKIESIFSTVAGKTKDFSQITVEEIDKIILAVAKLTAGGFLPPIPVDGAKKANEEIVDDTEQSAEEIKNIRLKKAAQGISGIAQLQEGLTAAIISGINSEIQALDNKFARGEIGEKEFQEQRKALLEKQAKANKANAIFSATTGTAAAIVQALNSPPPASFIFAAIAGAIGAAQIATIAAQPIPQFAAGTKGKRKAPPGMKLVGEEGPELIVDSGGYDILTATDSDHIMKILAQYGTPVQFQNTATQLHKPMKSIKNIVNNTAFDKIDWSPLLMSSDMQRRSLGKKLDVLHEDLQKVNHGLTRRTTRS